MQGKPAADPWDSREVAECRVQCGFGIAPPGGPASRCSTKAHLHRLFAGLLLTRNFRTAKAMAWSVMQRHRKIWRPLVAGCVLLAVSGCTIPSAGDPEDAHKSDTEAPVIVVIFAQNGAMIGFAVDRFFDGADFLARKTILRASDFFDPNSFRQAALQTLGNQVTRQAVTDLMKGAGLVQAAGAGPGRVPLPADSLDVTLAFILPARTESEQPTFYWNNLDIAGLETVCNVEFGLVWDFTRKDGRFVNVEPVRGGACL